METLWTLVRTTQNDIDTASRLSAPWGFVVVRGG
jgi:hypothetical protein